MPAMSLLHDAVQASLLRGQLTFCVLALFILVELAIPMQAFALGSRWRGLLFSTVGALAAGVTFTVMQALWVATGVKPFVTLHFNQLFGWTGPLTLIIGPTLMLMITDLLGYGMHRIQHGPLWRFHAMHHSVRNLHAASSYVHVADEAFRVVLITIPMSLVPIDGVVVPLAFTLITLLYEPYIHSPIRLHWGPLRRVFIDNRFHRIHHSREPAHFDKNFGVYFSLWDQLFGTAYFPKPGEWPDTGLADVDEPKTLWQWLDFPLRYRPGRAADAPAPALTEQPAP
jgi:sterol desaturase/sphingolipid hydroxylase (fatty acid hydroxylase superfamily)